MHIQMEFPISSAVARIAAYHRGRRQLHCAAVLLLNPIQGRMLPMESAGKIGAFIAVLVLAGATANPGYAQDAEHGKAIFKACAACHATDHDNRIGPGLEGIIGRTAGTGPRLSSSDAIKKFGIVLGGKKLHANLESPQKEGSRHKKA